MKTISTLCLILFFNCAYADNSTQLNNGPLKIYQNRDYYFDINSGVSQFNGLIGFEVQRSHYAIGIGYPAVVSLKYYVDPRDDSVYYGFFSGRYKNSAYNEIEDGIYYYEYERSSSGIGTGYKWQWDSGWNFDVSVTIGVVERTYRNTFLERRSNNQFYALGFTGGYSF
jgi:hypothetical protein